MPKSCNACGIVKPLAEFYKHPMMADGRLGKCKECQKEASRKNYAGKRAAYSKYERERNKLPQRRIDKTKAMRRHRETYPDRYLARQIVNNAIRDGRLVRLPCETCGTTVRVQAHHNDYATPLDVKWLCFRCHRIEHGQKPTSATDNRKKKT